MKLVYGAGTERLHQLEATAEVVQQCGHFVRVFRWTAAEMGSELLAQAEREYGMAKAKRKTTEPFPKWEDVKNNVTARCVSASSGSSTSSRRGGGG
jgi:hypothetical protein